VELFQPEAVAVAVAVLLVRTNSTCRTKANGGVETGSGTDMDTGTEEHQQQRPYRCFRLEQKHFGSFGNPHGSASTPADFHRQLCDKIRGAKRRVYLASLYIGPAVDAVKYDKEVELLDAIRDISSGSNNASGSDVEIKILLDHNRALRPVPTGKDATSHTTSAEACRQAIQGGGGDGTDDAKNKNHSVHLFSVLSERLQKLLPNPINEIAGVFHLKAYIVDDEVILSGANLSQEYFTDRTDRYMSIQHGGGGLVDCYADLISVLCQHGTEYTNPSDDDDNLEERIKPKLSLLESIEQVLTQDAESAAAENIDMDEDESSKTVAYAVPTFQAPAHFGLHPRLRSDVETVQDVLLAATAGGATNSTSSGTDNNKANSATVRLATAYLNPTDGILTACRNAAAVHLLTAGRVSHGFKPKNHQAGNKGKDWIPAVFFTLALTASEKLDSTKSYLWYYQRPNWTFHAKGIWLSVSSADNENDDDENNTDGPRLSVNTPLYMVTHGSGNFGARSEHRDMESNLLLFLPAKSPLQRTFRHEWNSFCDFAGKAETEPAGKPLAWHLRMALPYIRSFF
jgi:CDP-diacylglycerol--glycerol-3-phosphate 3-phosphatidyltransferase